MLCNNEDEDIMAIREKNISIFKEEFQKVFGTKPPEPIKEKPKLETKRVTNNNQGVKVAGNEVPRRLRRLSKKESCDSSEPEIGHQLKDVDKSRKTVTKIKNREVQILPEQVTEDILQRICYKSSGKIYDSINGTTCHQCRQKTIDIKSICRDVNCFGLRGYFCGFCLYKRYGENVAEVLKDPEWRCPPCRNICNCSLCRAKLGKSPTGILSSDQLKDFLNEENNKLE